MLWQKAIERRSVHASLPLPPEALRFRVHGDNDIEGFERNSKITYDSLIAALTSVHRPLASFHDVLDFGCGCGRTLRYFAGHAGKTNFYGTDIDAEAIAWCRRHLRFASFKVNRPLPPLSYRAGTFDLIYAISVFTHIDEEYQFRWLDELRRVMKRQGIVVITTHGPHLIQALPEEERASAEQAGFSFIRSDYWQGIFPDWYQSAYHMPGYIREHFNQFFDILNYLPRGMGEYQDLWVLQKK
ncbi:MAG: class I SAM-dependent methyltransferase [Thermomicrobiales bacterium]